MTYNMQMDELMERLRELEAKQRDPDTRSWRNRLRLAKIKRNLAKLAEDHRDQDHESSR